MHRAVSEEWKWGCLEGKGYAALLELIQCLTASNHMSVLVVCVRAYSSTSPSHSIVNEAIKNPIYGVCADLLARMMTVSSMVSEPGDHIWGERRRPVCESPPDDPEQQAAVQTSRVPEPSLLHPPQDQVRPDPWTFTQSLHLSH